MSLTSSPKIEILCLGYELMIGRTVNTNFSYVALELTKLGYSIQRETTIGDDRKLIISVLNEIQQRSPDVLFVMGGLGPTYDDIQLEVLADFMKRPLEPNENAISMIEEKVGKGRLSGSRMKMATLPKDSIPLINTKGTAPGVYTQYNSMKIFSLPGVPAEMKDILENQIIPILVETFGRSEIHEFGFELFGTGESTISHITNKFVKKYPDIYFKTHPRKTNGKYWLSLHLYSTKVSEEKVKEVAEEWREAILAEFSIEAGNVKHVFSPDFEPEQYDYSK